MREELAKEITEIRKKKQLSVVEAAKKAGISVMQMYNLEAGKNVSLNIVEKVMIALNIKQLTLKK